MVEAADASPRVLTVPKPNVWLTKFGDNALNYEIRVWIADPEAGIGPVRSEILSKVLELFRAHGVAIPYPQREIRVREWPESPEPAVKPGARTRPKR
jgi:small-conductance mechanosensitive channel